MSCAGVSGAERAFLSPEHVAPVSAWRFDRPLDRSASHGHGDEHIASAHERAGRGAGVDRLIGAGERLGAPRAKPEQPQRREQLPGLGVGRGAAHEPAQHRLAPVEVDRPAVVGVDERPERELVALVHVGDPGSGELEHELAERGALADRRHPARERLEVGQERLVGVQRAAEASDRVLPIGVRSGPVGVPLGLAERLLHVRLDPLGTDRPGADERLKQEVALDVVGRAAVAVGVGQLEPASDVRGPFVRHRRQRVDPRAHVGRALGVMGLGGEQVQREALEPLDARRVEPADVDPEPRRVAPDVIQGDQPAVAVERGVLDALGHDRRRGLLKARHELRRRVALEQQHRGDLGVHAEPPRSRGGRRRPRVPREDRCTSGRP